ncbi:MAG: hypothetical protein FJZ86_08665 [Chloroflexi bacterium]|nr:hypothetical protein [Chloroflexota bacterium]
MKYATAVKTTILVAVLVITNALLGVVCGRVYRQYEALFSLGPELFNLAIWVLGTIALVAMAAGLVVALVRPFWVIIVAFVLSVVALILAFEISIVSLGLGLVYLLLAMVYARSVIGELNDRLNFSVRPIKEGQGGLVIALILLVSISFGLGYREDALRHGFIFPPAYTQIMKGIVFPRLQAQIESQSEMRPEEKAAALEKAEEEFEQSLLGMETMFQPYAPFIWVVLAFMVSGILKILQGFVSWVPPLVLSGIFPLLELLGMTRVVTEMREIKRLILS